jgi:hypothetical protein
LRALAIDSSVRGRIVQYYLRGATLPVKPNAGAIPR